MRRFFLLYIGISVLFLSGLAADSHGQEVGFRGTHILAYKTMSALARRFQEKTGRQVTVHGGGCSDGIAGVVKNKYTMGGVCCPLDRERLNRDGLVSHEIARDIKAAVVHRNNPVSTLTRKQLEDIHKGKITSWKDLGWIDSPIAVVYRRHCIDMDEPVRKLLGIDDSLGNLSRKTIIVNTDKEIVDYVGRFPTAIAITSRAFADAPDIRTVAIDGVAPDAANVRKGLYQLTGPLIVVTKGQPSGVTKDFLGFALSAEGQAIVEQNLAGVR